MNKKKMKKNPPKEIQKWIEEGESKRQAEQQEAEKMQDAIVKKAESLLKLFSESRWLTRWFNSGYYTYTINELKKITKCENNEKNRDLVCRIQFIYDHTKNWDEAIIQITQMLQMEGY